MRFAVDCIQEQTYCLNLPQTLYVLEQLFETVHQIGLDVAAAELLRAHERYQRVSRILQVLYYFVVVARAVKHHFTHPAEIVANPLDGRQSVWQVPVVALRRPTWNFYDGHLFLQRRLLHHHSSTLVSASTWPRRRTSRAA